MPFQPGNTLNTLARKRQLVTEAITRAVVQDDGKRLRDGVEKLLNLAAEGDLPSLIYIRDTLQGRPSQQVTLSGDDEKPISVIRMVVVTADGAVRQAIEHNSDA